MLQSRANLNRIADQVFGCMDALAGAPVICVDATLSWLRREANAAYEVVREVLESLILRMRDLAR
jgi:hypothetical protein